jgi:hypothetical protein
MGSSAARDFTLLTGSDATIRDLFAGVSVDAPAIAGRTVMLGRIEQTVFVANRDVMAGGSGWTQSFGTFDIAHGALRFTSAKSFASFDFDAGIRNYAPTFAGGARTLSGFEVTKFSALRNKFAGHGLSSLLSR